MIDKAVKEFGRLDILVNNAGTTSFIPHPDLDAVKDEDWDRIMAVNVKGTFQCTRAARGPLEEAGEGEIINITSVAGLAGTGSSIPYCASKAAIINMTVTLARALAPKIRVNAVAPGFINGRWLRAGIGDAYEGVKAATAERLPLGRVCEPEDIAEAILSLITGSDLVTGHVLPCEGGMLIA
jgi:3-oxoacyl-[acyl-carrier protein] reductase